jgi:hypothetical protein
MKKKVYPGEYVADLVNPKTIFEINEIANSANFFIKLDYDLDKIQKRYIKSLKKFIPKLINSIILKHDRYIKRIFWHQYTDFESDDPCFAVYPLNIEFNNTDEIFEELKLTYNINIRPLGNNKVLTFTTLFELENYIKKSDLDYLYTDLQDLQDFLEIRWDILRQLYGNNMEINVTKNSFKSSFYRM